MQETVTSTKSETKKELKEKNIQGNETVQRFDVANAAGRCYGNPELWALWYPDIYTGLFDVIDEILLTPIKDKPGNKEKVYSSIERGIKNLIDKISSTDKDVQPLLNIRDRFEQFKNSEQDEFTIVITIHGPDSTIEYINEYYDSGIVTVDLDGEATNPEESALRGYEESLLKSFCGWGPAEHRPNNRFKRELCLSFNKTRESTEATIDIQSDRMKYTKLEKLFLKLGLSSPYKEEPIKEFM